jgi:hypothetical protein
LYMGRLLEGFGVGVISYTVRMKISYLLILSIKDCFLL